LTHQLAYHLPFHCLKVNNKLLSKTAMEEKKIDKLTIQTVLQLLAHHRKNILLGASISLAFAMMFAAAELVTNYFYYAAVIDARLANNSLQRPAGIYAAPRRVSVGQRITSEQMAENLLRAGYLLGEREDEFATGSFIWQPDSLQVQTNDFARGEDLPPSIRLSFNKDLITRIEDSATQRSLTTFSLPAEMLTAEINTKKQTRLATSYDELPPALVKTLIAIEDRRFFDHHGVDPLAVARALVKNLLSQRIEQGGSTITQQLVKNQFLTPDRTWQRKFAEAMMALSLERRLSKKQILALYCDRIYLGHSGVNSIYGFKQAARVFFGKELQDLSLSEAALLAGVVQAPNRYSPHAHLDEAIARRDVVLNAAVDAGAISVEESARAKSEKLALLPPQQLDETAAPYFVDYLRRELDHHQISEEEHPHLRIETTLDLDLQTAANLAVKEHLARLSKLTAKRSPSSQPEAALIALDPHSGEILAMVGGSDYAKSQLNRVTDAMRQPGSVFKPIVYAAAMLRGLSPASTFMNAAQEFEFGYKAVYRPQNFGRAYSNQPVLLREGLVRSLNVITVEAALQVGLGHVAEMAERLGLPRPYPYPSMALGAFEATPLDIARAYTAFANGGIRVDPLAIRAIRSNGEVLITGEASKVGVMPASMAYLVTDALMDVVNRGTAARIRSLGYRGPAAGKTGTSRDAWFVGYTPNLLVVVWVGNDNHDDLRLMGGEAAVPIWADFIKRALQLRPDLAAKQFPQPAGLEVVEIDPENGMIANEFCPSRQRLLLARYLTPGTCFHHQDPSLLPEYEGLEPESILPSTGMEPTTVPTRLAPIGFEIPQGYRDDLEPRRNPVSPPPPKSPIYPPNPQPSASQHQR
jgi:penicillin-binding protein 1B